MEATGIRHVLLVHDAYDDYVTCLANALSERTRVTLLHSSRLHGSMRDSLSGDVRTFVYPHRRGRDPRRWRAVPRIDRVAAAVGADVVHVQQSNDPFFNLAQLRSPRRMPKVVTVHDVTPHPGDGTKVPGGHLSLRVQQNSIDRFITHSSALRRDLVRTWRTPADRVAVVQHGELGSLYRRLPGHRFEVDDAHPEQGGVLFFGRVWPYKGLDRLVEAMNRLAATRPGLTLTIAGRGEALDRYCARARPPLRLEVFDRFIEKHEVPGLFGQAAVVCLPYLEASQSGVQALACGLGVPVVATSVGGLSTAVVDGGDGLLVPPDDISALTAALARLLDDRELRSRLATGTRARCESDLNWDSIAEQTLEVHDRALHDWTKR
ncbi:glycosyltransferase family 4 protein [Saccharopolyspora sp. NPDC002376]